MLADVKQRYKRIDYDYDLYSGKIKCLSYNRSFADQFYQRYEYDADNRITKVETSKDGLLWDQDASYKYYPHGPLARMNLGQLEVQGVDYAYTLQGWLKSINGDKDAPENDMGGDGLTSGNSYYEKDLLRHTLYYFKGDYKPIKTTDYTDQSSTTMFQIPDLDPTGTVVNSSLYNGNLAAANTRPAYFPTLYTNYWYDHLNRIKRADYRLPDYGTIPAVLEQYGGNYSASVLTGPGATTDLYHSDYTYDLDGNIKNLNRFGLKVAANKYDYNNGAV